MKLINFGAHARAKAAREEQRFDGPETDTSAETEGTDPLPFRDPSGFTHDRRDAGRARLLADCRDRIAHDIAITFVQTQDATAGRLIALADRATLAGSQDLYCAAHGFLTNHSQELLHQFRIAFLSASDAGFRDLDESMTPAEEVRSGELSLVADEDFERDLTIDKLSARAVYACSQQLTALDRRIAALLPGRRLSGDQNPLYPKAIFTAFLRACRTQGAYDQVDLTLLGEFSLQIAEALPRIYAEINRHLKEKGVLPDIPLDRPPSYERSGSATEAPEEGSVWSPAQTDAASLAAPALDGDRLGLILAPGTTEGRANPIDVFAQIAQRLMARQPATRNAAPFLAEGAPSPTTEHLVSALTRLQRGTPDAERFPGVDPSLHDATDGTLLRRIRDTPLIAWSHPTDAVTVDVVAMLFDLFLNDRELPDALRAQIGRLQIPVLKAAMMDREFFSDRQHPARRLLNTIAGSATGWIERDLPRLVDKVRTICEAILDGFEEDTAVFSVQLEVLTQFLAEEKERAPDTATARIDEVEQAERRALARQEVAEHLQRHTATGDLPDVIRGFLEGSWRQVLLKAWLEPGDEDQARQEAIATMEELVWSITPKTTPEERDKLFATLPDLLRRLQQGLASVALADEWDKFFSHLLRAHMLAVRPEAGATAAPTGAPRPNQAPAQAGSPTPADAEAPKPDGAPSREEHYQELAQGLRLGTWVEFTSNRGTRRTLRLDWCSQQRGAYLFANFQGDDSAIVTTERLAQRLRNRTARILDQDNFMERAVSQLLTGDQLDATSASSQVMPTS